MKRSQTHKFHKEKKEKKVHTHTLSQGTGNETDVVRFQSILISFRKEILSKIFKIKNNDFSVHIDARSSFAQFIRQIDAANGVTYDCK